MCGCVGGHSIADEGNAEGKNGAGRAAGGTASATYVGGAQRGGGGE